MALASVPSSSLLASGAAGASATGAPTVLPTVASNASAASGITDALSAAGHGAYAPAVLALPLSLVETFLSANENRSATDAQVAAADGPLLQRTNSSVAYALLDALVLPASMRAECSANPLTWATCSDWGAVESSAVAGCGIGALEGAIVGSAAAGAGAGPGAGIGCVAGATAGAIGAVIGYSSVHNTNLEAFETADAEVMNELRLIVGEASAVDALLPATSYFWNRLGDVAGEGQITNSTFNPGLALNASTIATQLGTVDNAVLVEMDEALSLWESYALANGKCIKVTGAVGTGQPCMGTPSVQVGVQPVNDTGVMLVVPSEYGFAQAQVSSGTASCALTSPYSSGSVWTGANAATTACVSVQGSSLKSAAGETTANYSQFSHTSSAQSQTGVGQDGGFASIATPFCAYSATCDEFAVSLAGVGLLDPVTSFVLTGSDAASCNPDSGFVSSTQLCLANVSALFNDTGGLEYNAVVSAQTYWTYLRDLGYSSPGAIPAQYAIIPPSMALPYGLCVDNVSIYGGSGYAGTCVNLNASEVFSLYLAELSSMARFFTSATYQNSSPPAVMGGATWGNLNLLAYGDVYLPNATPANSSYSHERFTTPGSWTIVGAQLLLFPELKGATLTVGQTYEVPALAPMEAAAVVVTETSSRAGVQTPTSVVTLYNLVGNGTANGTMVTKKVAGDAVYLTSCALNGVATTTCNAGVYSVNVTAVLLECSANSTVCPQPTVTTSGLDNCGGGYWGAFVGFFADLFGGCGGLSGLLAEIAAVVVVFVILILVVWAIVAYRGRKNPHG